MDIGAGVDAGMDVGGRWCEALCSLSPSSCRQISHQATLSLLVQELTAPPGARMQSYSNLRYL